MKSYVRIWSIDFSKIESGHMELESVDFELGDLIDDVLGMFAQPAEEKGLELAAQLSPPNIPLALRGDPFRLRQVLANLVSNAIKFTHEGEVVVRARLVETADTAHVSLCVEDTGIGTIRIQTRIFEHFAQADGTTTRQYGGTGLGLAICRRLLELMGGNPGRKQHRTGLEVLHRPGLPKADARTTVPPAADNLKGVRVLVVNDNRTNLEILQHQLAGWQMQVTCAEDGRRGCN